MELIKGLTKYKNPSGHTVLRLHYTADPLKNNQEWIKAESDKYPDGGINSLLWRREMEIDFEAGAGELVFQMFTDREKDIVISPFAIDETYVLYAGMDWGTRNPISFHVYAESVDKRFFAIWEYYTERQALFEVARELRNCPYYDRLQWIACDPTMFNVTVAKKDGFTSIAEMLSDSDYVGNNNITKLIPAHGRSDETAINVMKNAWARTPPELCIFNTCPKLISEIRNLKYPSAQGQRNSTEKIVDKNNHAWDDMKYFRLSHPFAEKKAEAPKFNTVAYLNEVTELAENIASQKGSSVQDEFNNLWGTVL